MGPACLRWVSAYLGLLPGLDALVCTGGVGEHDADLRREVVDPLSHLGLRLDNARNAEVVSPVAAIALHDAAGTPDERPGILVVPTDEESEIARQAFALVT